jgi:hypothetical protein
VDWEGWPRGREAEGGWVASGRPKPPRGWMRALELSVIERQGAEREPIRMRIVCAEPHFESKESIGLRIKFLARCPGPHRGLLGVGRVGSPTQRRWLNVPKVVLRASKHEKRDL